MEWWCGAQTGDLTICTAKKVLAESEFRCVRRRCSDESVKNLDCSFVFFVSLYYTQGSRIIMSN